MKRIILFSVYFKNKVSFIYLRWGMSLVESIMFWYTSSILASMKSGQPQLSLLHIPMPQKAPLLPTPCLMHLHLCQHSIDSWLPPEPSSLYPLDLIFSISSLATQFCCIMWKVHLLLDIIQRVEIERHSCIDHVKHSLEGVSHINFARTLDIVTLYFSLDDWRI